MTSGGRDLLHICLCVLLVACSLIEKWSGVKFKKYIVIMCEMIDRNKILASFRNMKNIFKMDLASRGSQSAMTNMGDLHT